MRAVEVKDLPLAAASLELKSEDGQPTSIVGYGSTTTPIPDSYGDVVAAGAFSRTIHEWQKRSWKMPILVNHDPSAVIGVWSSMGEDSIGLRLEGLLTPNHSLAKDTEASIRHGAISGLSIGFRTVKASAGPNGTRVLEDVDLFEVSCVTFPANMTARLTGVKAAQDIRSIIDFETFLREHGFSHAAAKSIARGGFKAADARDEPEPSRRPEPRDEDGATPALAEVLRELRGFRLTPV